MNDTVATRQILAATFSTPDGASRAATAAISAYPGKIANTAVLYVKPDGTPKFVETKDWGAGRGALVGGAIGLIGGPLGVVAGSGIGILASKLRDVGFNNGQLERLGSSLGADDSAVVFELASNAVPSVTRLLESLDGVQIVTETLGADVARLFESVM